MSHQCDTFLNVQNTRLRSVYLLEGSQGRGRAMPAYVSAAEQRKIYPYEQLLISNFTLPAGVERMTVEHHLSDEDFSKLFHMDRDEFYRLAEWKRNDLKRKVGLY